MNQSYDEIQVFGGVAERTGTRLERAGVRGRSGVCRSLRELGAKCRRLGDGFYYLASAEWPAGTDSLSLKSTWTTMG